jgi:peroxiredoxin
MNTKSLLTMAVVGTGMFLAPILIDAAQPIPKPNFDQAIQDFALKDTAGKVHHLSDYSDRKGVCLTFFGLGCPLSNLYTPRLQSIANEFTAKDITFLIINSNHQDSVEDLQAWAKEWNCTIPILKDEANKVADLFGAYRTNEVFLVNPYGWIQYHGAIDDQYGIGYQRAAADNHFLKEGITQFLAGEQIATPRTTGIGCVIGRVFEEDKTVKVTFHQEVERIFQHNCEQCHRAGQIGPFELNTYEDAKGWAGMIKEVVSNKRMPPWHANPIYGKFINDRALTENEVKTIVEWVDTGTPKGDPADAPPAMSYPTGDWIIGQPDVVLELPEAFSVPAEGTVDYQYFRVKTNFDKDVWVKAAEIQPGEPAVVHHVIAFIRPEAEADRFIQQNQQFSKRDKGIERENASDQRTSGNRSSRFRSSKKSSGGLLPDGVGRAIGRANRGETRGEGGFAGGILAGNVPGNMPFVAPDDTAKLIPKGAVIVFQMHYTTCGKAVKDRTRLGLIFADQPPKYDLKVTSAGNYTFRIPPGADNYKVGAKYTVKQDMKIIDFLPHLHLRGKAFRYEVVFPDGREEILLDVPRYDFGWQITYKLDKPVFLPKGTEIFCTATYDNSANNPWNPDPNAEVRWGDQTWHEMMLGWFTYIDLANPVKPVKETAALDDNLGEPRASR